MPPAVPMAGAPGEIRAYILTDGSMGEAVVRVTPIDGEGKPGSVMEFKIRVAKR